MACSRRTKTILSIAVCIIAVSASLGYMGMLNGGSLDFSDTQVKVVVSGSMDGEPRTDCEIQTVPVKSMVFISEVPESAEAAETFYSSLKEGDVLTFDYIHPVSHEHMAVTHRIVGITEAGGVYTYSMQGDAIADDPLNHSVQVVTSDSGDVIGRVTGVSPVLGELIMFLSTAEGKVCLIGIPCLLIIVLEVGTIIKTLRQKENVSSSASDKKNSADDLR